jgi:hypothetical protein
MAIAVKQIEAERALSHGVIVDDELNELNPAGDTAYKGAGSTAPYPYQNGLSSSPYQQV